MFNLLPKENKEEIYKEYRFRLLTLSFIFLGLTGIVTIILLVPSFLLTNFKYNKILNDLKILETETLELKDAEFLQVLAKKTDDKLNILKNQTEDTPLLIWGKVIENKTTGIKITSLAYNRKGDEEIDVVIRGVSSSRDLLTAFAKSLESEELFKNVNLPVSNLTREKDLDFSISFSLI